MLESEECTSELIHHFQKIAKSPDPYYKCWFCYKFHASNVDSSPHPRKCAESTLKTPVTQRYCFVGSRGKYICILCFAVHPNPDKHILHLHTLHTPDELMMIGYNWKILETHNNPHRFDQLKSDVLACFHSAGEKLRLAPSEPNSPRVTSTAEILSCKNFALKMLQANAPTTDKFPQIMYVKPGTVNMWQGSLRHLYKPDDLPVIFNPTKDVLSINNLAGRLVELKDYLPFDANYGDI